MRSTSFASSISPYREKPSSDSNIVEFEVDKADIIVKTKDLGDINIVEYGDFMYLPIADEIRPYSFNSRNYISDIYQNGFFIYEKDGKTRGISKDIVREVIIKKSKAIKKYDKALERVV